jgi:hypothetical protein
MSAAILLDTLKARGVAIEVDGDMLELDGPANALTGELLNRVRAAKADLLTLLRQTKCPAYQRGRPGFTSSARGLTGGTRC